MFWKRTFVALSIAAFAAGVATAQENATVTLRSGERISGQLIDLGGVGFTLNVNGQERRVPTNDVALIDFAGSTMSDSDWSKVTGGQHVMWLRSGETITGQLIDIGGRTPLRLAFRTASGENKYSSSDVSRIALARLDSGTGSGVNPPATGQGITVSSQQEWTSTNITVRRGEWLTFDATGQVRIGGEGAPTADPGGVQEADLSRNPIAGSPTGALIGRIGNGRPFLIGNQDRVRATASGLLFLGVNDSHLPDNQGSFQVTVGRGSVLPR
jgi:hypothetical protein